MSLIHMTGFDLFGMYTEHVEPERCSLRCTFWSDFMVFMLYGLVILGAFVLAMPIFFSSLGRCRGNAMRATSHNVL